MHMYSRTHTQATKFRSVLEAGDGGKVPSPLVGNAIKGFVVTPKFVATRRFLDTPKFVATPKFGASG